MITRWVACLVLLTGVGAAADTATRKGAIVDGQLAVQEDLLATVALVSPLGGAAFCTGTLIAPRVVITAGHCLHSETLSGPGDVEVVAGALVALEATDDQIYTVQSVFIHSGWDPAGSDAVGADPTGMGRADDIAVLILAEAVDTLGTVGVPTMGQLDALVQPGDYVVITGYGILSAGAEGAGTLYIAETPYQKRNDTEFLVGAPFEPDSCQGDSGGPVYAVGPNGALWLLGAASRGRADSDTDCGEGGIYSLVPAYLEWIGSVAGDLYGGGSGTGGSTGGTNSGSGSGTGSGSGGDTGSGDDQGHGDGDADGDGDGDSDSSCAAGPLPASGAALPWLLLLALPLISWRMRQSARAE